VAREEEGRSWKRENKKGKDDTHTQKGHLVHAQDIVINIPVANVNEAVRSKGNTINPGKFQAQSMPSSL